MNSRTDILAFRQKHSDSANRFQDLGSLVNAATEARENVGNAFLPRESKLGVEDFKIIFSMDDLFDTCLGQNTIFVNTTYFHTDAILIHSNKRIQVLSLDQSIFQDSKEYYSKIYKRFGYNEHGN